MRFYHIGDVQPSSARDLHADLPYRNTASLWLTCHLSVTYAWTPEQDSLQSFRVVSGFHCCGTGLSVV